MHFAITFILANLSAGALARPTETTNVPMPAEQSANTRSELPYTNYDTYNHTLPFNAKASHELITNASVHHHHHHHHPTSNNATALFRRGHKANISSYSDSKCTNAIGPLISLADEVCHKFTPVSNNVGINWGSWPVEMQSLTTYTDDNCETPGPPIIHTPTSLEMDSKGAGSCKSYASELTEGGAWKSVWMTA